MKRDEIARVIRESGVVAIVRGTSASTLGRLCEALRQGGIRAIEVTFNTRGAPKMIEELVDKHAAGLIVGAGTVLDADTARTAILSGASFVLAPNLNLEVIETCHRYDVLPVPGAMTPTEILSAWSAGAEIVKVFPAGSLGPRYFRELRGPLPQVEMMAVGGVNLDNAAGFIEAGAAALGVGGELVNRSAVAQEQWDVVTARAQAFLRVVTEARTRRG